MARAWHLKSRPQGMPTADNFELQDIDVASARRRNDPIRNRWLSVDPYMRGRMNDVKSYVPPFQLGEAIEGGAVGEVVESQADGFREGRPGAPLGRLARRGRRSCTNGDEASGPGRRAAAVPGSARDDRRDGLFRIARRGIGEGGRPRFRFRRCRGGGIDCRPDRESEGNDGHRLRGRQEKCELLARWERTR